MSLETMTKLASQTVGAGGTSTVTFSNIPQSYSDLKIVISGRTSDGNTGTIARIKFNGSTTDYSSIYAQGRGDSNVSGSGSTSAGDIGRFPGVNSPVTDNTFSNTIIDIPNYSGNSYKSYTVDSSTEANQTISYLIMTAGLWSNSSPITSIDIVSSAGTISQHSTFTLYGIKNARKTAGNSIKATGGNIVFDGTYVYHVFNSTGAFVPTQPLTADILQVAGGGGGGSRAGGGGGAGGLLGFASQTLSSGTSYTCTIGAGGAGGGGTTTGGIGSSGGNSQFGGLTASVGGGWGIRWLSAQALGAAGTGGSGGGATMNANGTTSSAGQPTTGQGYAGGAQGGDAAGGGGAGGVGGIGNGTGGAGGVGSSAYSSWGVATGSGQNVSGVYYFAGGGGGGMASNSGSGGTGGYGGGGNGNNGTTTNTPTGNGVTATGGGGGGAGNNGDSASVYGGNGGSGIIIVRYKG